MESTTSTIGAVERSGPLPLSVAQRRLWFLLQLDETVSLAYHVCAAARLRGELDAKALKAALDRIVERHESLRTTFDTVNGEPVQMIGTAPDGGFAMKEHDLRGSAQPEQALQDCLEQEARDTFDLQRGPLVRGRLIRCAADEHVLLISMHHLISDGTSTGVLLKELSALYAANRQGHPDPLPGLPIQYADYAHWHRCWLSAERLQPQAEYWRRALSGAPQRLELPTDRDRPAVQSHVGAGLEVILDEELVRGLKALGARHGTTLFMTLLTAWAVVVSRLSGQDDVVIGTAVANRTRVELEQLIGFFVNTQALRIDLSGAPSGSELLRRVREQAISALSHVDIPFEQVVERARPVRTLAHTPLFQTMLAWRPPWQLQLPGLQVEPLLPAQVAAQFDLMLWVGEVGERVVGAAVYATALFDESTVARYIEYWKALLRALLADESCVPDRVSLLTDSERRQLEAWNATARSYPVGHCLHELFEAQTAKTPDAVALVCAGEELTYSQLNGRANQLAHYLIERGVGPDVPVAICIERSVEMLVGLLGILKAGGAYVPLDPTYPRERLRYMLQDSRPAVVLLQDAVRGALGEALTVPALDLQADARLWSARSRANLPAASMGLRPDHLAYIIYTSGSTGRPKGAMNEHRAVVNRLQWMQQEYALESADRVLQKTPFSFDVSVWELFWPLMSGACLVMARPEGHKDPFYMGQLIEQERISIVHFVPSMLQSFLACGAAAQCGSLRHVMCSGEELSATLQSRALESLPQAGLHNLYGPTEAAIDVTYWACRERPAVSRVPIGRPIANTRIYILDRYGEPVPCGVVGEIHIGGVGVGRGYWRQPQLTAERFLSDPFSAEDGARMYRTGDLGRWQADGSIAYLGRTDSQVKIRGFRIELGEIEAALRQQPGVTDAVVVVREDQPGVKRLVAYYVCSREREGEGTSSVGELRSALQESLPAYMVPAAYVRLTALPLNANGKLDRRAVPDPTAEAIECTEYEPPQGHVEQTLAAIWQQLLKLDRIGRRDSFFALGGHSLLALSLIERLRRRGMRADLPALFTHTSLAGLAESVTVDEQELAPPQSAIPQGCERITPEMLPLIGLEQWQIDQIVVAIPGGAANVQDIYPLAPLQQGILFHHLMQQQGDPYVLSSLLAFESAVALQDFVAALQAVIDRHDILRTALAWEGLSEPVQIVWRSAPLAVRRATLESQHGARELWERFDPRHHRLHIRRAPLFEAIEAHDHRQGRWLLLLLFHHLGADHTTLEIIFEEVRAHLEGRARELPAPVPFRNFVARALRTVPAHEHESFFRAMLGGIEEPTAPFGLMDVQGDGSGILEAQQDLDAGLAQRIRGCARAHRVSAASLYHLAWAQVLARLTDREEVVFGTVLFGRMQAGEGADRALGLFINTLPVRVAIGEESVQAAVQTTHERLVQLLRHEHASLVTAQRCSAVAAPAPLFTSVLNYRYSQAPSFEQVDGQAWPGVQVLRTEERSNYPIILSVDDLGEGFRLTAQVHATLDPERLCRFMYQALDELVRALVAEPHRPSRVIDVLPEGERQQLTGWNATQTAYPQERCIHELFEEQAARTPDAIALVYEGERLAYADLNAAANRLAHYLRERGVIPDVRVAICADSSIELVVGLLAILKAGGAYVPLDPTYPRKRLRYMLEDSEPELVLLQGGARAALGEALTLPCVDLQADAVLWRGHPAVNPQSAAVGLRSDHLAYVTYTSGSTGQPKGVANEHRGMVNRIAAQKDFEGFSASDVCCHKTSISFVDAVFEIFGPLCSGSRLVLLREARDPAHIAAVVGREGITHLLTVPTLARFMLADPQIMRQLAKLRIWTLSGEEISAELLTALQRQLPGCEFIMQYGASEVSSDAALYKSRRFAGGRVPIGPPLQNVQAYVLDRHGALAPVGVIGEICVGGVGVARGYLNKPELTAERFVRNRFVDDPRARLYRTGDLGRWRPDGMLECLGRRDGQVKIRGYRIELGEIEAALRGQPGVGEAAVLAREDQPGEKRLVAYVTPRAGHGIQAGSLREQLLAGLPEYMVPAAYVQLEALPLTANGKLDRRALPAPESDTHGVGDYEPPRGELEEILAAIWQEVLGISRVGRGDNFFVLGGHSLLATRAMAQVRDLLQVELPLRVIFETPCLRDLAARTERLIRDRGGVRIMPLVARERPAQLPLSHAQERLWFVEQLGLTGSAYNLGLWLHLEGELDVEALRCALEQLIGRHEALRTRFEIHAGIPLQVIEAATRFELAVRDVAAAELPDCMREEGRRRFALSAGAPFRAVLLRLGAREHALLLTIHHITADGWSLGILARELSALYGAGVRGQPARLAPLTVQYADYALWQRDHLQGEQLQPQLDYWRERLSGLVLLRLPTDHPRPRVATFRGAIERFELSPEVSAALKSLARSERATVFMVLLGAFQVLLGRYSRQTDVVVGTAIAGRTQRACEGLIGCFVNVLALRTDLSGDPRFTEVLGRVREVTLGAYAHQDLPFERLVAELQPERDLSRQPVYQVSFTFQNVPQETLELPGLTCRALPGERETAKLDLALSMHESDGVLRGELEYATDLFEGATIRRMIGHFEETLGQLGRQPQIRIGELQLTGCADEQVRLPECVPITSCDEVDRGALPVPELSAYVARPYEAPVGIVEETLAEIWQNLLDVERVGRNDNFFELGGHSLLIVQVLERLRRVGLSAEVRRVFESPTLSQLAGTLIRGGAEVQVPPNLIPAGCERITPQMLPLIVLEQEHIDRIAEAVPGGAANIQDIYPLAPLQEGMLFHHLLDQQGADAYVLPVLLSVSSRDRVDELIEAVHATIERYDVLRTAIFWEQLPRPVQVVYRKAELKIDELVLSSGLDAGEQIESLMRPAWQRLDLRQAPLVRLQIAQEPHHDRWYVLLRFHHVTCDHVTTDLLTAELVASLKGQVLPAPDALPYRNHVARMLAHTEERNSAAFFRDKLGEVDEPTAPFGILGVFGDGSQIREAQRGLESELAARLRSQARRAGVSAATVFHAAWALVVANISGRDDVVFGTMLLGRLQGSSGVQRALGMFINTLPLRLSLADRSAKELVEQTQRELVELLAHEHASLAMAQRCSSVAGSAPLFTALFNYRHSIPNPDAGWDSAAGIRMLAGNDRTSYPITMSVDDLREGFSLTAQTDPEINPHRMLDYLNTALGTLVEALEHSPRTPAVALPVLPDAERREVIEGFNPAPQYRKEQLIQELFEAQVRLRPHAVAVIYEGESLTYAELNARANQLAWYLRGRGIGPDRLVGICVERSLEMVVGLLGILKAGGAYLPLDPGYPAERLAYMLGDAAPAVVLTQESLRARVPQSDADLIILGSEWHEVGDHRANSPPIEEVRLRPDHLAYVIYTSGSTGRPKGAMNEHRAVVNRLVWMQERYRLDERDRILQKTPLSFDVSVWELFWPLAAGARLVIARPGGHQDPVYLAKLIEETEVTTLHFVPSMLQAFLGQHALGRCPSIRHIVCSGEELPPALQNKCLEQLPDARLSNLYGPTECAVDVTSWECTRDDSGRRVPVGRPITNTRVYVLNRHGQPTPLGVPGEIYLAGVQVGRGYLNKPQLTAERFVPDPFSADPAARMYRSGDLGKWRSDGTLEYLGRNDEQVKIRGFRIELGEIEAQLLHHAEVREAVVIAREDAPGEKRLVGYVIAKEDSAVPSAESLREHLEGVLPEYMVPSAFMALKAFPLTPNGKLDRRALPVPDLSSYTSREYEAPRGEVEEVLAGIWQELLHVERVGRNDNFFELGGHSLLIVQVLERLRRVGLSAEVRRVFESPTLSDLASTMIRGVAGEMEVPPNLIPAGCERITPHMLPLVELEQEHIDRIAQAVPGGAANIQDIYPLAPLQEGMLFHHLLDQQGTDAYVLPTLLSVSSRERVNELIEVIQAAIGRHEVLRTAILWERLPKPLQVVYREARLQVEEVVLEADLDAREQIEELMRLAWQRLDLHQAPLVRLQVAHDPHGDQCYALLRLHHVICDHISYEILITELVAGLKGRALPVSEALPYRNHVARMLVQAKERDSAGFFHNKLSEVDEPTAPFGILEVFGDGSQVREARQALEVEIAERLRLQARRAGVSAATLFHAAWALVVASISGRDDVVFGTMLLGRLNGSPGLQGAMGMFINTLPFRLRLTNHSAKELIEQTQRELVELLAYEHASLAVAQRCSSIAGSAPLFTALLNYRHSVPNPDAEWESAGGIRELAGSDRTNYPIAMSVDDLGTGFSLAAQTDQGIDPRRIVAYLATAAKSLIEALEHSPRTAALALQVLPESEQREVIQAFNATDAPYPESTLMHALFEEQARRTPQAVAAISDGICVSYAELNEKANALAEFLRRTGMCAGEYVPILLPRSLPMLVAQIAILKCGGAYVPLDPETPVQRLTFILQDCDARRVLSDRASRPQWAPEKVEWTDCVDAIERPRFAGNDTTLDVSALSAAYVMYTSGSTGAPKGVVVPHRAVNRLVINSRYIDFDSADRIAHCSNPAFDAATFEIWGALLNGASTLLVPQAVLLDAERFADLLIEQRVTVLWMTVGLLNQYYETLAEAFSGLRYLIAGGDIVDPEIMRRVLRLGAPQHLLNAYGPTEGTTFSTTFRIEALHAHATSVPIGRPISNTAVYILDARLHPLPLGASGELFIGGAGVALGYLNRPELTAERFVPDPFSSEPGARMYKTGDVGRWRADGTIEFLGRNDAQVKIRGFRIELGEIEAQLLRLAEVREAVAIAREDAPGERRLVAYVIAKEDSAAPSAESLREHLKGVLPEYMVPSAVVVLEALPLTPNGKLDRRALPAPDESAYTRCEYEAPRGEVEEVLSGIWQQLLKVPRVGRNDNFFELGGHSLLIVQMMERLRRVGLSAEVRRVYGGPRLSDLASTLIRGGKEIEVAPNLIPPGCERITPQMLPLVELEQEHIDRIAEAVPGGAANIQDIYPLAPLQEGMLFHHLLGRNGGDAYVLAVLLAVSSRERLQELIAAFHAVIDRHDVLRTAILWEGLPQPVQVVYRLATLPVEEVTFASHGDSGVLAGAWMSSKRQRLDLRQAPLMRLKVAEGKSGEGWSALLQLHHVLCDNRSLDSMLAEVAAFLDQRGEELPAPVPYRRHVAEARAHSRSQAAEAFFRHKLGDVEQPTAPFGLLDVRGDGSRIGQATQTLDPGLAKRLRAQARRMGVTVATLFHAAWGLVVARTSSREDVVFGTVLLGRMQSSVGAHRTLGMFINTLPLRLRLPGLTARALVEQTQRELVELFMHEQTPLAIAQKASGVPASTPLFTSILNYRHGAVDLKNEFGADGVSLVGAHARTNYPVMLSVDELSEGFRITADSDKSISAERLVAYMCTAVKSLVEALEQDLLVEAHRLEILPASEHGQVLSSFNATRAVYPHLKLTHQLFEEQEKRTPNAVAVEYEGQGLTYAQLNARANQLARYLIDQGIGPDHVVGIFLERGLEMMVGLLAILKAGGAYLPLDPNHPGGRLRQMLEDAAPRAVLTETELAGALPASDARVIALEEKLEEIATYAEEDLPPAELGLSSENLAYVIYTSGSTGTPKGTAMRHRSAVNLIEWHRGTFGSAEGLKALQFAALSFDVAFQEIFSTLCTGGTLVLVDEWARRDARKLIDLLAGYSIGRLFVPPLMLQSLAEYCTSANRVPHGLRDVITAGEQLKVSPAIRAFFGRLGGCRLHNHYGPTETHVVTALTLAGDPGEWPALPSIGRPIANTRIYLLDGQMQPVPVDVTGEIYIAGANVAQGYLNRPELTEQRFLPDPFVADPNARMYKTGDLGRWKADGTIEYLGRNDDQVKIRGFRVELGEIEAQLIRHWDVRGAAVQAREDVSGEKRLVAYVILRQDSNGHAAVADALREHLKRVLPEYMVPSAFVVLERLPLTPTGKLDWRALPAPGADGQRQPHMPARTPLEHELVEIWREVLKVDRIGIDENFFDLGGHSLRAVRMIALVKERLSAEMMLADLFDNPTIAELCARPMFAPHRNDMMAGEEQEYEEGVLH